MASYGTTDGKPTPELTVYVCGSCGFKGGLDEVTAHSHSCSTPGQNVPPVHSITVIDNSPQSGHPLGGGGGGVSGGQHLLDTTPPSSCQQPLNQPYQVNHDSPNHDDEKGCMLTWTPAMISVMVERFVELTRSAGEGTQKKKLYEQIALQVEQHTAVVVTGEQVGNKIKFMRKQHMAVKALMMANKPIPPNKISPYFKMLDEVFGDDTSSAPLNRALEKCFGGKVKVVTPQKGNPNSNSIVVVQSSNSERSSLGSAFSQYIGKLIDELSDEQKDEVQAHIISYIFSVKQQANNQRPDQGHS